MSDNATPKTPDSRTFKVAAVGLTVLALAGIGAALLTAKPATEADARPVQIEQTVQKLDLTTDQLTRAIQANPQAVVEALTTAGALQDAVDQHILDNPETILDSLEAYRAQVEAEANKPIEGALQAALEDPETGHLLHVGGPADAPVTIVKFHDDNCSFCRRAIETVERLLAERDDVAVYIRPFPVLGQDSRAAAEVSVALAKQGLYVPYYKRLDDEDVKQLSRDSAMALANELGADMQQLTRDMNSGPVSAGLTEDLELGREAGVQGTPTFFVGTDGTKRVRGAVPFEAMVAEVEAALARRDSEEAN